MQFRSLYLSAVIMFGASAARSEEAPRLAALIPVVLGDNRTGASIQDRVAEAFEARPGLRLISREEIFVAHGKITNAVQSCGGDAKCLSAELTRVGADLGLIAVVNVLVDPPLIALKLVNTRQESVIGSASDSSRPGAEAIGEALHKKASQLLDEAGFVRGAHVVIESQPAGAIVQIPGQTADVGAPNAFFLRPGSYKAMVSSPGYESKEAQFTLASGDKLTIPIELAEQGGLLSSPWFWTGLGAVVVGGVVATVLLAQPSERCICVALPGTPCPPC